MGFKILAKAAVQELVKSESENLIVEIWHGSKPIYYLKRKSQRRPETIGRLSKNIFSWFELIDCDDQPPGINVSWKAFANK